MPSYPVPAHETRSEIVVVNSRFIASLAPTFSVEQAKAFIARIRTEFADASHNVPVYLIGYGSSVIAHCSDAGEPSGTAGRPALEVLRGSGLGDATIVITRYFGGTLLGTGGLVRAYSEAARQVIQATPRAQKIPCHTVMTGFPYRFLERVRLLTTAHHGQVLDEDFAAEITLTARFPVEDFAAFRSALLELSNGAFGAEILESEEVLFPIQPTDSAPPTALRR